MATATETLKPTSAALMPKFSVQRADLVKELSLAVGAVERKTTIPILSNILLRVNDLGRLMITATDLEIAMRGECESSAKAPGAITLPAKRLLEYVRLLPDGEITIKPEASSWVTITCGKSKSRIPGMGAENFPDVPAEKETVAEIQAGALSSLIKQTAYAISMEESRFTLNGSLLVEDGDSLQMVATDGHRMTIARAKAAVDKGFRVVVPRKALSELVKLCDATGPGINVAVSMDENHIFFAIGSRVLTTRKLTGNFPDFSRVMSGVNDPTGHAVIDRAALASLASRVQTFADQRTHSVKISITDGQLSMKASSVEHGESEEAVDAQTKGGLEIGLNAGYFLETLNSIKADTVQLNFKEPANPLLVKPATGEEQCLCVLMPMRL